MRYHNDVDTKSHCGGSVTSGKELFNTDYWCVYCGAKWSENEPTRDPRIEAERFAQVSDAIHRYLDLYDLSPTEEDSTYGKIIDAFIGYTDGFPFRKDYI